MGFGDARCWDEETYRKSILKDREIQTRTVFRTFFAPYDNIDPNLDTIVVACSDGSVASYSISKLISSIPSGIGNIGASHLLEADPSFFLRAHDGPAYDVKFYESGENSLLLSCGDDGCIRGWRWKEIGEASAEDNHIQPVLDMMNPQHRGPWGALAPIPETNAIAVDVQGASIFSAAGDSCAYCWDVETSKTKMVFKGHLDYLHCIIARNSSHQIITGSEDGTTRTWDCRSGKSIHVITPEKDSKINKFFSPVTCIALDASESWLACGSGKSLSVWNLPSFDCISRTSARAPIQDMVFENNQILAVGAEHQLSRFDIDGMILSQLHCAPPSAFSISLHPLGVIAVAGYGGLVDIISQFGSHLCTFRHSCI